MSSVCDGEVVCVCMDLGLFPQSCYRKEIRSSSVKCHVLRERPGGSHLETLPQAMSEEIVKSWMSPTTPGN